MSTAAMLYQTALNDAGIFTKTPIIEPEVGKYYIEPVLDDVTNE
jgi:hypothetical protein